jgi:tetratricopeptide (TPR) repeat protein
VRLFVFTLVVLAAFAQEDPAALYREAVDRQRQGDLGGAADLLRRVLRQDSKNVAARSNLGAALAAQGHFDEAIPEYQEALRDAPAQMRPYLERNLALAYYKSGRLEQAAPLLMELHEEQKENRDAALLAADCLLQLAEPAKALSILEPLAPQAASDKALAWVIGNAYLKLGRTAEAQRILDPILKDTASAEGNYALGMAMFSSGDYPAAVKALARALELDPTLAHAQSFYGQALLFTGDPEAALAAFRKQLAADANDYDANFQAAAILARRRSHAAAEALLRRAVMLRPGSPDAHYALAETLRAEKKEADALTELKSLLKQWPEFGPAHASLAELYAGAGLRNEENQEKVLAARFAMNGQPPVAAGLKVARRFDLEKSDGSGKVRIDAPVAGKPTVLVFGSYSCPNFRAAAPALNDMAKQYARKAGFLLVYIREAHATDQWQSTINEREQIQLAPAASREQKHEYATMCQRKLHLQFPSVVDGLDNAAEKAYSAWPSRVYVISAEGRIRYSSGLTEQEFDAVALRKALTAETR